jgi:type I restriction enzyme S subunit
MRKMKDSGIEWIGKIPDIWRQTKLKYVTKIRSENGMYSPEQDSYIGLENIVSRSNKLIETETIYESALYSICKKGDILFNKLRPYLAKAIISPIDGFCTGELLNIKHFDGEKRFLWYYLLSDKFIEVVNASTYGAKMPRANTDFILNLPVFLPPLAEQQRIADFLDEKCGEIDSIRSDIQKQIDILNDYKKSVITEAVTKGLNPKAKLKDSGIEWIGKIPEGWITKKLKYLTNQPLQYGANESGCDYDDSLPRYIRITDISMDNKLKDEGKLSLEYDKAKPYLLEDYDLLFARSGASVGKTFLYKKEYGTSAFAGYLIKASLDKKKVSPKFVYYNTLSCCYESWKQQAFTQATIQNIGAEKYNTFVIPVPPLPEQKAIADYLDEKCSEIDATIADKQKQLETLDKYKKSLIFEYVTGKKEVLQ